MAEVFILSQNYPQHDEQLETQEDPIHTLDDVLENYLNLLDRYQELQQKLAKNLSSGFFSIAQANFTSPNRIRYGQDFYDQRMQASLRVSVRPSPPRFTIDQLKLEVIQQTDGKPTPSTPEQPSLAPSPTKAAVDPLKWFGILVPPTLRKAQAEFKSAVVEGTAELASLVGEIGKAETEIRKLRSRTANS